jgi:F0F1-type ATP synthase delta subunit
MLNLENSIHFHTDEGDIGKDSIGKYQANLDSFVKVLRESPTCLNVIEDYYLHHFYQKEHLNFLLQRNDSCSTKSVISVLMTNFHISTSMLFISCDQ